MKFKTSSDLFQDIISRSHYPLPFKEIMSSLTGILMADVNISEQEIFYFYENFVFKMKI